MQEYPWLHEDDFQQRGRVRAKVRREIGGKAIKVKDYIEPELAVNPHVEVVFDAAALAAMRAELRFERDEFFYIHVMGGFCNSVHKKKDSDGLKGMPRGGVPVQWCTICSFPTQFANYYSVYQREGAYILACEYCRRADYFFGLWVVSEVEEYIYDADTIASYQEDMQFLDYMTSLDVMDPGLERGLEVRSFVPTNPT